MDDVIWHDGSSYWMAPLLTMLSIGDDHRGVQVLWLDGLSKHTQLRAIKCLGADRLARFVGRGRERGRIQWKYRWNPVMASQ